MNYMTQLMNINRHIYLFPANGSDSKYAAYKVDQCSYIVISFKYKFQEIHMGHRTYIDFRQKSWKDVLPKNICLMTQLQRFKFKFK